MAKHMVLTYLHQLDPEFPIEKRELWWGMVIPDWRYRHFASAFFRIPNGLVFWGDLQFNGMKWPTVERIKWPHLKGWRAFRFGDSIHWWWAGIPLTWFSSVHPQCSKQCCLQSGLLLLILDQHWWDKGLLGVPWQQIWTGHSSTKGGKELNMLSKQGDTTWNLQCWPFVVGYCKHQAIATKNWL